MKKNLFFALLACASLAFLSCNKEEDRYEDVEIPIVTEINSSPMTISYNLDEDNSKVSDFYADYDSARIEFALLHTHNFVLSGENLESLYAEAEKKFKTEFWESDKADAESFVKIWQEKIDKLQPENYEIIIKSKCIVRRLLGENKDFVENFDLPSITYKNISPQN